MSYAEVLCATGLYKRRVPEKNTARERLNSQMDYSDVVIAISERVYQHDADSIHVI